MTWGLRLPIWILGVIARPDESQTAQVASERSARYDARCPNELSPPERIPTETPAMRIRIWSCLAVLVFALVGPVRFAPSRREAERAARSRSRMQQGLALFKEKVRPALVRHCLDCHGGKSTKGDLDLSDRKPLVDSGVLEGGGKESRLTALIRHAEEPHMPQKAPKLPDATIADIVRWIDLGAPYDRPLVDRAAVVAATGGRPDSASDGTSGRSVR